MPTGIAYAELAGLGPEAGLYASLLPLVAYAFFGTSRQLMIGPSAAGCALVAAAIGPLAGGDETLYLALSMALTLLVGLMCIGASFLRLGALADFLSKPILIGFMNGVAISIVFGQLDGLLGYSAEASDFIPRLMELGARLPSTHWPTVAVGVGTFALLVLWPRVLPRVPATLVALVAATVVVRLFGLDAHGVSTIGEVPAGLPALRVPPWPPTDKLALLVAEAAGLALVIFSGTMVAARSFAARNRYDVDADRELAALGAANVASAFSQSFAVSGSGSRRAAGEAAGGRTQVTGIVAAARVAAVLLLLTGLLRHVPVAALAAVLVMAGLSLLDWDELRTIHRIDPREFWLSITATVGVVVVGAIDAILFVVVLAILRFVRLASRPKVEILGEVAGHAGFHSIERHPSARPQPGLVLFRFNGPIIFFSAPYFKREILKAAANAGPDLKWLVIDMLPVSMVDATGLYAIEEVSEALESRGIVLGAAARATEWAQWAAERGFEQAFDRTRSFTSLQQAVHAFREEQRVTEESGTDPPASR